MAYKKNSALANSAIIGIDAINLRGGGGQTHLIEILAAVDPNSIGVKQVVVWGNIDLLNKLVDRYWLKKVSIDTFASSSIKRIFWQLFILPRVAVKAGCSCLFAPGGTVFTGALPTVTMCRNLLPFDSSQKSLYGFSIFRIKLELLKCLQLFSFKKANLVIFLSDFAREVVCHKVPSVDRKAIKIPHGVNKRFLLKPRLQIPISEYSYAKPFSVLYVSTIEYYKNHDTVLEAFNRLRRFKRWPLRLVLVGDARPIMKKYLISKIQKYNSAEPWVEYRGKVSYQELHEFYGFADLGVFASSCENLPNTLIEMMTAGLPIVSSSRPPMTEVLGDGGMYFDPRSVEDAYQCFELMIENHNLRLELAKKSFQIGRQYNWQTCSEQTFRKLVSLCSE